MLTSSTTIENGSKRKLQEHYCLGGRQWFIWTLPPKHTKKSPPIYFAFHSEQITAGLRTYRKRLKWACLFFFFFLKATVKMELFLNTIQTGWATDGIYTLIQRSVIAFGIIKNIEGTSFLFYTKLGGECQRRRNQKPQNLTKKDQVSQCSVLEYRVQFAFFACLNLFSEGLQTWNLHNLTRWRQVQASIDARDVKMLFADTLEGFATYISTIP